MENQASKRKELKYVFELKDYTVFKRIIMEKWLQEESFQKFCKQLIF